MKTSTLQKADPAAVHSIFGQKQVPEDYLQVLNDWDFSIVKQYLVDKGIYPADEVDGIEREYKRFLSLTLAYSGRIPICQKIDDFWHTHILFTEDYHALGQALGVGYVHHRPSILDGGPALLAESYGRTLNLYRRHFGEPPAVWETNGQICINCCFTGD